MKKGFTYEGACVDVWHGTFTAVVEAVVGRRVLTQGGLTQRPSRGTRLGVRAAGVALLVLDLNISQVHVSEDVGQT